MTKAVEANPSLGVFLCADNHLSNDLEVEIEYAMGRPKSTVRDLVGQVRGLFTLQVARKEFKFNTPPTGRYSGMPVKTAFGANGRPNCGEMGQQAQHFGQTTAEFESVRKLLNTAVVRLKNDFVPTWGILPTEKREVDTQGGGTKNRPDIHLERAAISPCILGATVDRQTEISVQGARNQAFSQRRRGFARECVGNPVMVYFVFILW